MLLDDMLAYLSSGGVGTPGTDLIAGRLPQDPDTLVALFETGGLGSVHAMAAGAGQAPIETAGLEVIVRASTYVAARALAQKAWLLVDGLPKRTINGVQYHYGKARQMPMGAGYDLQDRALVTFNADILKALSSTS